MGLILAIKQGLLKLETAVFGVSIMNGRIHGGVRQGVLSEVLPLY
jgi:hypothetical protein